MVAPYVVILVKMKCIIMYDGNICCGIMAEISVQVIESDR